MDITYLGLSSFKIHTKSVNIVTDPFDPAVVGLKYPKTEAEIVTVSHHHRDHDYVENFPEAFIIDGPGEYQVKGVDVLGIPTFHDVTNGAERGKNTVYEFRLDGMTIVHAGDLGHKLTDSQAESFSDVDVLLIPVGGYYSLDAATANAVITQLEPKIVIPMHYQLPGLKSEIFGKLSSVENFLKEMGKSDVVPLDKLVVSKDKLPEEMQVVVLK